MHKPKTDAEKLEDKKKLTKWLLSDGFNGTFVPVPKDPRPIDEIRMAELEKAHRIYEESLKK